MAFIRTLGNLLLVGALQFISVGALYTVVRPPVTTRGDEVALIAIPGAFIAGEAYEPLCLAVQNATPLKLWVGIASGFPLDLPNLVNVGTAIELAIKDLHAAGMSMDAPIFVAAHSYGGWVAQTVISSEPEKYAGLLLWASYLTGSTEDLGTFPTPVLHVSGDIDGNTRMTRIGRVFRQLSYLVTTDPSAEYSKSVVLVNGVNHGQFATGKIPPNVVENDIRSDLSQAEAQCLIAKICSLFMVANIDQPSSDAKKLLREAVCRTNETFMPLFMAEDYQAVGETSEWAILAQKKVASIPASYQSIFTVTSQLYSNQEEFEESKPSIVKDANGNILVTATAIVDLPSNPNDNSLTEESAVQIATKTKNQEAVKEVLGGGKYGAMRACVEINQEALTWALRRASPEALQRYNSWGREMFFGKDIEAATGSQWVAAPLDYKYTAEGDLVVTSTSLYTAPDFSTPNLAGMYYCKLLSPYRAMEWIYVDSLKPYIPENGT